MKLSHGRGIVYKLFDPSNGAKNIDVHVNVLNPGVTAGAIHYHEKIENVYIVLEGEGKIVDKDGNEYPVHAGQAVFIKPGETHEPFNTGKRPLRLVEIYAPPQPVEAYAQETFDPSKRDHIIVKTVK